MIIFISLRIVMKHGYMKFTALLLTLWYLISVIGFDVHVCKGSARSFITTFMSTCKDIHPGHDCLPMLCSHHVYDIAAHEGAGCCHSSCSHSGEAYTSDTCCTDSYQVLILTGGRYDEQKFHGGCCCHYCPCPDVSDIADIISACSVNNHNSYFYLPKSLSDIDFQSFLGIWRI